MALLSKLYTLVLVLLLWTGCVSKKKYQYQADQLKKSREIVLKRELEISKNKQQIKTLKGEISEAVKRINSLNERNTILSNHVTALTDTVSIYRDSTEYFSSLALSSDKVIYSSAKSKFKDSLFYESEALFDVLIERKTSTITQPRYKNWKVKASKNKKSKAFINEARKLKGKAAVNYYDKSLDLIYDKRIVLLKANELVKYDKSGAAKVLRSIISYGPAKRLYNSFNPVRIKNGRFLHSICRDGSISYSRGRGTCSHHGGVRRYVYAEVRYRDY
ncbi:MAG: hypothetical protein AAF388_12730 [Bacteroidota bacterium]